MAESYSTVETYYILFIHLSVDEHLGWFHILATVTSAEINMGVQMSLLHTDFISLEYILDNLVVLFLIF